MKFSEHFTFPGVRCFLICCKCRSFLSEYKQKYVLHVYTGTYIYIYTHINTNAHTYTNKYIYTRRKKERKLFFVLAPLWVAQKTELTQALRSSWLWCPSCVMSGAGAETLQWQQLYQSRARGNLPPAEPAGAVLSSPPALLLLLSLGFLF